MVDLLKKMFFSGLGAAALTKDKIDEIAKEMTKAGNLSEDEGRKLADELKQRSQDAKEEIETKLSAIARKTVEGLNLATKSDMERIENRLTRLEKPAKKS